MIQLILLVLGAILLAVGHTVVGVGLLAFALGRWTGWRRGVIQTSAAYQRYIRSTK